VIATASRPESQQWVQSLGADYVIDHTQPLAPQVAALGLTQITHVASLTHTNDYLDSYVEMLKPMGKIALIDDPQTLDVTKLKRKSISLHWEFMFTRSMFNTDDMQAQHQLLNEAAALIDEGYLQTTLGQHLGVINANNLKKAHQLLESGSAIGKIVLEGF
jgi:zinc-binding alcohol dehydrogenase family protein